MIQSKFNPAWPFFYSSGGDRFLLDDFGFLVPAGNLAAGIRFAREGLSAHLAEQPGRETA